MAQAVQERAQDMRTMMVLPRISGEGLGDMQQGFERLVQGVIQTNLRSAEQLFRLADTGRYVPAQQQFLREYLSTLFEGTTILVRSVRQLADQALQNLDVRLCCISDGQVIGGDWNEDDADALAVRDRLAARSGTPGGASGDTYVTDGNDFLIQVNKDTVNFTAGSAQPSTTYGHPATSMPR